MGINYYTTTTISPPGATFLDQAIGNDQLGVGVTGDADYDILGLLTGYISLFSNPYRVLYCFSWRVKFTISDSIPQARKVFDGRPATFNYGYFSLGLADGVREWDLVKGNKQFTKTQYFIQGSTTRRYIGDNYRNASPIVATRLLRVQQSPFDDAYGGRLISPDAYADVLRCKFNQGVSADIAIDWTARLVDYDVSNTQILEPLYT